jgi:hypothetical protein
MLNVIDTAKYQVALDLSIPWGQGFRCNYVKAGGDNSGRYIAEGYYSLVDRSRAIGYRIGHYWVPSAAMDPIGAADYLVSILRGWNKASDFIVLDNENLDGAQRYGDAAAAAFIERLKVRLGIPGRQILLYTNLSDGRGTNWSNVLATGANFLIAAPSYTAFAFPDIPTIPRGRIVGHQTGAISFGGVVTDVNVFVDWAFDYGSGTAGLGSTSIVGAAKTYLAWAEGTGYLVTEDGWHGLPSPLVYQLFYRLINSPQADSPFVNGKAPVAFSKAEADIIYTHLRLVRIANQIDVTIDPIKFSAALRDELVKAGIPVNIEQLQNTEFQIAPEKLAPILEAAAVRVAGAIRRQTGGLLALIGGS